MIANTYLYTKLENFDFSNPPADPIEFAKLLGENLLKLGGIGLAANQIGYIHRACAIKTDPMMVMYNPKIVYYSNDTEYMDEGCLSFPNLVIPIKRSKEIRVRFTMPNGEVVTNTYQGLTARIIQHEVDHLDGITFKKRASKFHLDRARNKQKSLQRRIKNV